MGSRRAYIGLVRKTTGSDYWLDFPDIQGCAIGAGDLDALRDKAGPILQHHIDTLVRKGFEITPPSTLFNIKSREPFPHIGTLRIEVDLLAQAASNNMRLFHGRSRTLRAPKP
jgi:hypothetical protein